MALDFIRRIVKDLGELKIQDKLSFPNRRKMDKVLLALFSSKFRNHKHRLANTLMRVVESSLKAKFKQFLQDSGIQGAELDKQLQQHKFSDAELMEELDILPMVPGFNEFQWLDFKNYIKSKEFKARSVKGKEARGKQKHTKVTGSKAFADILYEFEKTNKRKPGHVELFDLCYKRKDGTYVKSKTKKQTRKLSEYRASGGKNLLEKEKEILDHHIGPDQPGRARGYGVGVTKSQVSGFRATLEQITWDDELANGGSSAELSKLKEQLAQQQELIAQQQQMMQHYMANTTNTSGQLQSELSIYRTAFGDQFHANPMSSGYAFTHGVQNVQDGNQASQRNHLIKVPGMIKNLMEMKTEL